MSAEVLEVKGLIRAFGALQAVDDISLSVARGEVVGIIGTNGSGKTTLLNLITGYLHPTAGHILLDGRDITGLSPRRITRLGVSRSFQIPQLYTGLSVIENVLIAIAAHARASANFWAPIRRADWLTLARDTLTRFGLEALSEQVVSSLPEGSRKILDVALGFVLEPQVLLMDEPTSGVSAADKFAVMERLMTVLAGRGVTTVFVEHDMEIVERFARRVLAFDAGKVIADGQPQAVLARTDVRRAVLGED